MRILGLHTIALIFGVLIAACTSISHMAQKPSVQKLAELTLEVRSNTNPRLPTEYISKANHPSLTLRNVDAFGQRKP